MKVMKHLKEVTPWEWEDCTYDYEKQFYDVMLPNWEILYYCWPNAWKFNELVSWVETRTIDIDKDWIEWIKVRSSMYSI